MMNLQQFNSLGQSVQYQYLLLNGSCIAERKTRDAQVLLFQLDSFYIELFLDQINDEVLFTRSFDDTELLAPYFEQIQLEAVLS
jgi:hypothetical protein